jgi:hypothetical protein
MLARHLLTTVAALFLSSTVVFADPASNAVDAAKAPLAKWPGPTAAVSPAKGKTVYVVTSDGS